MSDSFDTFVKIRRIYNHFQVTHTLSGASPISDFFYFTFFSEFLQFFGHVCQKVKRYICMYAFTKFLNGAESPKTRYPGSVTDARRKANRFNAATIQQQNVNSGDGLYDH